MGPVKQAAELDLEALADATRQDKLAEHQEEYWPEAGLEAVVASCAWLLREVESGAAFLSAVSFSSLPDSVHGVACWDLPCSKADPAALGKQRYLHCHCPGGDELLCPARALRRLQAVSQSHCVRLGMDASSFPLLVTPRGNSLSKEQVISFYRGMVSAAGSSSEGITGRSPRVTGARRMARAGLSVALIQVFGRWGSNTVLHYLRDSVLGDRGSNMRLFNSGVLKAIPDLQVTAGDLAERISKEVKRQLPQCDPGAPAVAPVLASVTDEVMEQILEVSRLAKASSLDSSSALASVSEKVSSMELDLQVVSGEVAPSYKQCNGGLIHRALPRGTSPCGWPWLRKPGREVCQSEWDRACAETDKVCARCR